MIDANKYNCREQGECYLTYRRRLAREKEQYENDRSIKQSNKEWIEEYSKGINNAANHLALVLPKGTGAN